MPKIERKTAVIFGIDAPSDEITQVGSLRNGAPVFSKDLDVLQALQNFKDGWPGVAMGDNSPAMEDDTAINFILSSQIAYLLQNAGAEWIGTTEYYLNSICAFNGQFMVSLQNNNLNHSPATSPTWWAALGNRVKTINAAATYTATVSDDVIRGDSSAVGGNLITITLPLHSTMPLGKIFRIKNASPLLSSGTVRVIPTGADTFDGGLTEIILASGPPVNEAVSLMVSPTGYDII